MESDPCYWHALAAGDLVEYNTHFGREGDVQGFNNVVKCGAREAQYAADASTALVGVGSPMIASRGRSGHWSHPC